MLFLYVYINSATGYFGKGYPIPCSCYTARRNWLSLLILKSRARPVFAQLNNSLGDGGLKRFEEWDIYLLVQADSLGVDFST